LTADDRVRVLHHKIGYAREIAHACKDKGTAANLRLYIAELEQEIAGIELNAARGSDKID
jgi:hypothetical protein